MTACKINKPETLVLNKSWVALTVSTIKDGIIKLFQGSAKAVDENYNQYNWSEWLEKSQKDDLDDDKYVRSAMIKIRIPHVIVLQEYNRIPKIKIKLTRRNLFIRDKGRCVYTGARLTLKNATMDHVFPKSKGGKTCWTNLVLASVEANTRKANRTPEEAGMKLFKQPKKPIWNLLFAQHVTRVPKIWEKYIHTDQWNERGYWDVELID